MLFMSIQYAFVVYMVGLPTRINQTSLSEEPIIFIALTECWYKGSCVSAFASSCFHHHGDYISAEKKFPSPIPLCHESRDFLYFYDLVYSLGEFLSPPLLKMTFCILSCRKRSWHWPVKNLSVGKDQVMKCERKLNQSLRFIWKKLREQYHTYA